MTFSSVRIEVGKDWLVRPHRAELLDRREWTGNVQQLRWVERGYQRLDVSFPAQVREPGWKKFQVTVADVSPAGCRLISDTKMHAGTRVWIAFPGLAPLETVIIWRDGEDYGCNFHRPLHAAVFDHLVKSAMAGR